MHLARSLRSYTHFAPEAIHTSSKLPGVRAYPCTVTYGGKGGGLVSSLYTTCATATIVAGPI